MTREQAAGVCKITSGLIEGVRSNVHVINYGVPQESVLGPLLFLIYLNDFPLVIIYEEFMFKTQLFVLQVIENYRLSYESRS